MPIKFDPSIFAGKYTINDHGICMRILGMNDNGDLLGHPVRPDNSVFVSGRRFLPKQIAYITYHGELPRYVTPKDGDQHNLRKENLWGSDVHPRWSRLREAVPINSVKSFDTPPSGAVMPPHPKAAGLLVRDSLTEANNPDPEFTGDDFEDFEGLN